MKQYCFDGKKFLILMWVIIESLTKDSINFHTIDVKLIGLFFSSLFLATFLNIGETYAISQSYSPGFGVCLPNIFRI